MPIRNPVCLLALLLAATLAQPATRALAQDPAAAPDATQDPVAAPDPAQEPVAVPDPAQDWADAPVQVLADEPAEAEADALAEAEAEDAALAEAEADDAAQALADDPAQAPTADPAPAPAPVQTRPQGVLVDGIAAQVGADIVLISEVQHLSGPTERMMRERGAKDADLAMMRADVLERLIERALIHQVVRRAELEATPDEVDEAIEGIAIENDITYEQLRESVEAQGLSFEDYRSRIRAEIEQSKVVGGMVRSQVRVDEKEIRALYDKEFSDQHEGGSEVHIRHILVPIDPERGMTRTDSCTQTDVALAEIAGGIPFPEVAARLSAVNPGRGGDLGFIHERDLASWMADAVSQLDDGQVSSVIEMPFGCNLLELVERRDFHPLSYEDAKDVVRQQIFNERMGEEYKEFLEELRENTFIERKGIYADATRLRPGDAFGGEGDF